MNEYTLPEGAPIEKARYPFSGAPGPNHRHGTTWDSDTGSRGTTKYSTAATSSSRENEYWNADDIKMLLVVIQKLRAHYKYRYSLRCLMIDPETTDADTVILHPFQRQLH